MTAGPPPGQYPRPPVPPSGGGSSALKWILGICAALAMLMLGCAGLIAVGSNVQTPTTESETPENEGSSKERRRRTRAASKTYRFSGNGIKDLGDIRLGRDSTIRWTHETGPYGGIFAITDNSFGVTVSSQDTSGTSQIDAGRYENVNVNATGDWTLRITPNE